MVRSDEPQIRKRRVQDGRPAVYYLPSQLVQQVRARALAEGCTASEIVRRKFGIVGETETIAGSAKA